jgi:hypothetical protein
MCRNDRGRFDLHKFYIRWVPEVRSAPLQFLVFNFFHFALASRWLLLVQFQRFVFINHSQTESLEKFHGLAVNLNPNDIRTPFHGAFLIHEMRVRGRWPLLRDRPIPRTIRWQSWISPSDVSNGEDHEDDSMGEQSDSTSDLSSARSLTPTPASPSNHPPSHRDPNASGGNFMTLTNPFANPVELDVLKRSFAMQPNWKAAVVEGESWAGNADDNTAKYRRLVGEI